MNLQVRKFKEIDFNSIVDLMTELQDYFSRIDTFDEIKKFTSEEEAQLYIKETLKKVEEMDGVTYVAEVDGKIVGFIQGVLDPSKADIMHNLSHHKKVEGWIGLFYAKPDFRGIGVGHALLERMKEYFLTKKCDVVKLYVAGENKLAIKIYEKYGFKPTNLEMTSPLK